MARKPNPEPAEPKESKPRATAKKSQPKPAKAAKPTPASSAAPKPEPLSHNPFTGRRDIQQAPLHASRRARRPKPVIKSYSFYDDDLETMEYLTNEVRSRTNKRVSDSLVVRIALTYLERNLRAKNGQSLFERDLNYLMGKKL